MVNPDTAGSWPDESAERVRARREQLHATADRLAKAIAAPGPGRIDVWWAGVGPAIAELAAAFDRHVHENEDPDGLFDEIIARAPRLSIGVDGLRSDHHEISETLRSLSSAAPPVADPEVISFREQVLGVLSQLTRHEYAGADLLFEAYNLDIGAAD